MYKIVHTIYCYNYLLFSRHKGSVFIHIIQFNCQNTPVRYVDMRKLRLGDLPNVTQQHAVKPRLTGHPSQNKVTVLLVTHVKMINSREGTELLPWHCLCGVGLGVSGEVWTVLLVERTVPFV